MSEKNEKAASPVALLIKNALILFAFTLGAGLLLGVISDMTSPIIAEHKIEALKAAYGAVLSANEYETVYSAADGVDEIGAGAAFAEVVSGNPAYAKVSLVGVIKALDESGNVVGYVLNLSSGGYASNIEFSMGITTEGHINGISITASAESAGLGAEADPVITSQLSNNGNGRDDAPFTLVKGKDPVEGEVQSITGATITSNAVVSAVNAGFEIFENVLKGAN